MLKLFSKASNKVNQSYWLKSGSYSFLSKVSSTLFAFINFYILIRLLSKEDFGAWVLFLSVASLMELIKHGFVRNPLIRYLASCEPAESGKVQASSIYLNAIIGFLEIGFLILFSFYLSEFWNSPQLKSLFLIYVVTTVALIPVNHFDIIQQAKMQFKGTFLSSFIRQLGLFVYILCSYFYAWKFNLDYLAAVQCLSIIVSGFISFYYARPYLEFSKKVDKRWVMELFHYGKYTFGTNVSSMIVKNVDSWMLGKLISPASVAIFNPAIRLSNLVEVPTDTLTSILFPQLAKRVATEGLKSAKHLYEKAVGTITAIMLPVIIFVIVLARPIILFVTGTGFEETIPILQITMLYGLIIPFNRFLGITLDAIGKAKTNFGIVLQMALMNAVANFVYIRYFGIIGAAYGTLTTYIIALVYNQIYLHKNLGVRVSGVFRHFVEFYVNAFNFSVKFIKSLFKH